MSVSLVILASTALVGAAPQSDVQAKKEIIALEQELGRAMIHRDVAALQRIVGDDWICQSATGRSTKQSFISDVANGKLVMKKFVLHDIHIGIFGKVAYLMAADDEVSTYAGADNRGTYNWLDVWVRRNGRWESVATQITKVASRG